MTQEDFSDPQVLAAERGDLDGPQAGDRITVDYEDYANLVNERDALKDRVARWIPEWPRDEMPPIGVPVRVVWSERGKSDPKRAIWTGQYWANPSRTGHYECSPEYWLYEPPLPEPPCLNHF